MSTTYSEYFSPWIQVSHKNGTDTLPRKWLDVIENNGELAYRYFTKNISGYGWKWRITCNSIFTPCRIIIEIIIAQRPTKNFNLNCNLSNVDEI